jgi:hypothetical protein
MLSIGAKMAFVSAQTGDKEATLRKHYTRYLEEIDPDRNWIEAAIRQSEKSEKFREKSEKSGFGRDGSRSPKMKKPLIPQGLKSGAGEEGRTPDLMLGERKKRRGRRKKPL